MVRGVFGGVGSPDTCYLAANPLLLLPPDWLCVLRTSLRKWTWGVPTGYWLAPIEFVNLHPLGQGWVHPRVSWS